MNRVLDAGRVFSFYNRHFLLLPHASLEVPTKAKIDVLISPRFGIRAKYKETLFQVLPYIKPEKIATGVKLAKSREKGRHPIAITTSTGIP